MKMYSGFKKAFNSFQSLSLSNPRLASEYAFAIAVIYKEAGKNEKAIIFGRQSISLFYQNLTEDYTPHSTVIANVAMPSSFFSPDVIQARLAPLEL